jgi:hypothetical protein
MQFGSLPLRISTRTARKAHAKFAAASVMNLDVQPNGRVFELSHAAISSSIQRSSCKAIEIFLLVDI